MDKEMNSEENIDQGAWAQAHEVVNERFTLSVLEE
jgi:hypothetical protein